MVTYNLYLNTVDSTGFYNGNFSSSTWFVHWDQLFKGENYKYKKCRLRFKILGRISSAAGITFVNSLCNISCSLPTNFSSSNTLFPTLLNIGVLNSSSITTTRLTTPMITNTVETLGVNCQIPKGSFPLTIGIAQMANFSKLTDFGSTAQNFNYNIHLQFELYDTI
jgi:hypothetical protein